MIVCMGKFRLLCTTTRGIERSPFTVLYTKIMKGTTGFACLLPHPAFLNQYKMELLVILLFFEKKFDSWFIIDNNVCVGVKTIQFYNKRSISIQLSLQYTSPVHQSSAVIVDAPNFLNILTWLLQGGVECDIKMWICQNHR